MTDPNPFSRPISLPALRIFVSYHHKDGGFGTKLVRDLRTELNDENAVWYTVDDGQGTADLWFKIVKELSTRNIYIFVLSPDAVSSSWVKSEMSIALRQHIFKTGKLIPVIYRRCEIPEGYNILQTVNSNNKPYEVALNELLLTLGLPARKVGAIPWSRRPLLLLLVFLLIVGISAVSIFAGNQFFKTKPHTQVGVTATIPTGSTLTTPTIPGTVSPSIAATLPLPNLYPHPPGTFIIDPLGHACQFRHGAYHISAGEQLGRLGQFNINSCYGGSSVSNFVYEIQMTIVKGDFGGIFFRYQPGTNTFSLPRYYDFLVGSDGTFQLIIPGEDITFLAKGSSAFINQGQNVQNTLAVVANGSHIDLYVNKHIVASVDDTSFSQGQIGITALGVNNQTDVTFTNQKVWSL